MHFRSDKSKKIRMALSEIIAKSLHYEACSILNRLTHIIPLIRTRAKDDSVY